MRRFLILNEIKLIAPRLFIRNIQGLHKISMMMSHSNSFIIGLGYFFYLTDLRTLSLSSLQCTFTYVLQSIHLLFKRCISIKCFLWGFIQVMKVAIIATTKNYIGSCSFSSLSVYIYTFIFCVNHQRKLFIVLNLI